MTTTSTHPIRHAAGFVRSRTVTDVQTGHRVTRATMVGAVGPFWTLTLEDPETGESRVVMGCSEDRPCTITPDPAEPAPEWSDLVDEEEDEAREVGCEPAGCAVEDLTRLRYKLVAAAHRLPHSEVTHPSWSQLMQANRRILDLGQRSWTKRVEPSAMAHEAVRFAAHAAAPVGGPVHELACELERKLDPSRTTCTSMAAARREQQQRLTAVLDSPKLARVLDDLDRIQRGDEPVFGQTLWTEAEDLLRLLTGRAVPADAKGTCDYCGETAPLADLDDDCCCSDCRADA